MEKGRLSSRSSELFQRQEGGFDLHENEPLNGAPKNFKSYAILLASPSPNQAYIVSVRGGLSLFPVPSDWVDVPRQVPVLELGQVNGPRVVRIYLDDGGVDELLQHNSM